MASLTEKQKKILDQSGLSVVKACPGSGKTFSVAAKLADLLKKCEADNSIAIAALSFTNVAWEQIGKYLDTDFHVPAPGHPHFLGTIDSFLNRYIFLPFGHFVMDYDGRPKLAGPPHDQVDPSKWSGFSWGNRECNSKQCKLNDFSYDVDGNLFNLNTKSHFNKCASSHRFCTDLKKKFNKLGYATQSDANYFGLRILETQNLIAKALAARFTHLIIDEAQDTSRIQMQIFNILIENGLSQVLFVGDPDQAIYEWRDAEPKLFHDKFNDWKDNSVELAENRRSTQEICDFATGISSLEKPMQATDEAICAFGTKPELWTYQAENELPGLRDKFVSLCKGKGINIENAAILTRSWNFVNSVRPGSIKDATINPWHEDMLTMGLAKSRYYCDRGDIKKAFKVLEKVICKLSLKKTYVTKDELNECVGRVGFVNYRKMTADLMNILPSTNCKLGEWVQEAQMRIKEIDYLSGETLSIKRKSSKCDYPELNFNEIFDKEKIFKDENGTMITIVHAVKGMTLEAVLLILKKSAANNVKYTNLLYQDILESEELRVLYVGMTRPRKVLILAIPASEVEGWSSKFESRCEIVGRN